MSDALVARCIAALGERWGSAPTAGRVRADRPSCTVFDLADRERGRLVVKADAHPHRHARERAGLEHARAAGVPITPIVDVCRVDGRDLLVLGFVDGPTLRQQPGESSSWPAVGTALRAMHDRPPPPGSPRFGHERGWLEHLRWWTEQERRLWPRLGLPLGDLDDLCDELRASFDALAEAPSVLLHGDLQPEHVLLDGNGGIAALLDFGDASLGDPAWDVAVLVLDDAERLASVLDGYRAPAAERSRIESVIRPYRLLRYLGEASWLVEHGFDPGATLDGLALMTRGPQT